uniref:Uncharacterized protein n=1 Tax=Rhizophora mucronata TaxID=61149 RepID=A0A2P2NXB9_RHIMU
MPYWFRIKRAQLYGIV